METFGNPVETVETGGGNTKLPRVVPCKAWCFTLNNYTKEEMETLETLFKEHTKYIFGEEIGEECGTPHLQGYIECKVKCRPSEKFQNKRIHWAKAKAKKDSNVEYCSKDGKVHTNMNILKDPMEGLTLLPWQENILELLKTRADQRTINWYWEEEGCAGKTTFAKHLCMKHKALYVNGKAADVKCAIVEMIKDGKEAPEIVIFGFPRVTEDYVSYSALEEVKDGLFFSGKFESRMCVFNPPHVIVFANFKPDTTKLSKDRWRIVNIASLETRCDTASGGSAPKRSANAPLEALVIENSVSTAKRDMDKWLQRMLLSRELDQASV